MGKSLKILHAIVRIPKMCDLFHKAELAKVSKEMRYKAQRKAVHTLR